MRGNNLKARDWNMFPKTVKFNVTNSTKPGCRKVQERTGLLPEDAGKPRGFGRWDVVARTPYNDLLCFALIAIMCGTVNVAFGLFM